MVERQEPDREHEGYVYFLRNMENERIKIGYSFNRPDERLAMCRVGAGAPLERFALMHGSRILEDALHIRFLEWHVDGEWFNPAEPLMEYIRENARGWEELLNADYQEKVEYFRAHFRVGDPSPSTPPRLGAKAKTKVKLSRKEQKPRETTRMVEEHLAEGIRRGYTIKETEAFRFGMIPPPLPDRQLRRGSTAALLNRDDTDVPRLKLFKTKKLRSGPKESDVRPKSSRYGPLQAMLNKLKADESSRS
jgi:hypothetical protein